MRIGLILGDQLSGQLATLQALDRQQDRIVMAEVLEEAEYVAHHPQKIALLFSAMRHFAKQLQAEGWQVSYQLFQRHSPRRSLLDVVQQACRQWQPQAVVVTECGEYRLQQAITMQWPQILGIPVQVYRDQRFFCSREQFASWASDKKQLRMEYFYREMRKRTGYLMQDGKPLGGQWNFDADNRKRWNGSPAFPAPPVFERDAIDHEVLALVAREFASHPGSLDNFAWATTRAQALQALEFFIAQALAHFGDFQDAMVRGESRLFHSLLSPYMNCGLLLPAEVCDAAQAAYTAGKVPLNAVEGFIRQILGWREYVRGIYWLHMPQYAKENQLDAGRALPRYYWDGNTGMACMADCFRNTFQHAYAHHIQRLMITGNFALLAGISPAEVCAWYLAVYADAYDWVELPNTLGMVLHADGGYLGSKPYAASGNYIHKMSDYCQHCQYNVKTRHEQDSCPFNSLYWHFMQQHRTRFASNPRMGMVFRTLDSMDAQQRQLTMARAEYLLAHLDTL